MKLGLKIVLGCAICALFTSCSDDGDEKTPCNASSFVSACNADLTHVYVCENGSVVAKKCSKSCDQATGTCTNPDGSVSICTEASYPTACKAGVDNVRTLCKDGQKAEETCATGRTCVAGECIANDDICTDETHPATCKDDKTLEFCNGGMKDTKVCAGKCDNGECVVEDIACTEADYPAKCLDSVTRTFCKEGKRVQEKCTGVCEDNTCKAASTKCGSDFVESCVTPQMRQYCQDGVVAYQLCKNGQMCNSSLKTASCRTPVYGDACSPSTFSEICMKDQVVTCDADTGKVIKVDCKKTYGDNYKCDIADNFGGQHVDVAMCYSKLEDCEGEDQGSETYEYCYHDDETGYRWFYKTTYICQQFNTGKHRYVESSELCPDKGKCGQKEIRKSCNF